MPLRPHHWPPLRATTTVAEVEGAGAEEIPMRAGSEMTVELPPPETTVVGGAGVAGTQMKAGPEMIVSLPLSETTVVVAGVGAGEIPSCPEMAVALPPPEMTVTVTVVEAGRTLMRADSRMTVVGVVEMSVTATATVTVTATVMVLETTVEQYRLPEMTAVLPGTTLRR